MNETQKDYLILFLLLIILIISFMLPEPEEKKSVTCLNDTLAKQLISSLHYDLNGARVGFVECNYNGVNQTICKLTVILREGVH